MEPDMDLGRQVRKAMGDLRDALRAMEFEKARYISELVTEMASGKVGQPWSWYRPRIEEEFSDVSMFDLGEPHAARNTDPATSKAAVLNRKMRWNTGRANALRVYYQNPSTSLTDVEVRDLADRSGRALGACWWKRVGELRTEYDPPLTERTGTAPGEFGDEVGAWRITEAGAAMYRSLVKEAVGARIG